MNVVTLFIPALVFLFFSESPAHAYIGPGMAGGVFTAVIGIIAAIFMICLGIIYYPIKRWFLNRKNHNRDPGELD